MQDISTQQNIINQHFNDIACSYNNYRTLDKAPVKYITHSVGTGLQTICNLGCGTGRYLVALIEACKAARIPISKVYGVDISSAMLEEARNETCGMTPDINWLLCPASKTNIPDKSISLATAFNSIHHMPIKKTLDEVGRILLPGGIFAIYTRVLGQESEHIWGRYFPGYVGHSEVLTRESMSSFSKYNKRWQLIEIKEFTFRRKTSLSHLCEQTENKHYSTLARYSKHEFENAYGQFVENIRAHYADLDNIEYLSSYSLFIYRHV